MNRRSFLATLAGAAAAAKALALTRIPAPAVLAPALPQVEPAAQGSWLRWIRSTSFNLRDPFTPVTRSEWRGPAAPILFNAFQGDAGVLDLSIKFSPVEICNSWGEVVSLIYYDEDGWVSALVLDSDIPRLAEMMKRLPIRFILSDFDPGLRVPQAFRLLQNSTEFVT